MIELFTAFCLVFVRFFQNWPSVGNDGAIIMTFALLSFIIALSIFVLQRAWINKIKYHAGDQEKESNNEPPQVPEGLTRWELKEDSLFLRCYLKDLRRYPLSLCDYAPYCILLTAFCFFLGLTALLFLMPASTVVYWIIYCIYRLVAGLPWFIGAIPGTVAAVFTQLFAGVAETARLLGEAPLTPKLLMILALVVLFYLLLSSRFAKITFAVVKSKLKRFCIPIHVVKTSKN